MDQDTLRQAMDAFWAVIAKAHPEITTGDLAPDATIAFENACADVYKAWIDGNRDSPANK